MPKKKRTEEEDNYQVGYMRPPKEHQFKPGHSGNPKGRPKGTKNTETIVRALLDEVVEVSENGKRKRMTRRELMIYGIFRKAMGGDVRALKTLLEFDQGAQHADGWGVTHGVLVVPGECATAEEWVAKYRPPGAPTDDVK